MAHWTTETLLKTIAEKSPNECVTETRLAELTNLTPKQVENACQNLRRHGFIRRNGKGCHRLTPAGKDAAEAGLQIRSGPNGPQATGIRRRDAGMRQRAWTALAMRKPMTVDDIVMRASMGDERDPRGNLYKYLRALQRAGYLMEMPLREKPLNSTSNGCKRWVLVRYNGPVCPVVRDSRRAVYDPNNQQMYMLDESDQPAVEQEVEDEHELA